MSGYDEYEGVFGPLSAWNADNASVSTSSRRRGARSRRFPGEEDHASVFYGQVRGFRRKSSSRAVLGSNEFARREKYLTERRSKRRLASIGDEDGEMAAEQERPTQDANQIWLPPKNFSFRQRAGKLDTRTIARLDLQKIIATTDIDAIQRHLENLAFSDVTLEDVQQYSDAYFLKLFQIAQLTLEYLMNVQDSLVSHCDNLETQCEGLLDESLALEQENERHESEITALKKEIRQKQSTLATFEVMLLNASAAKRVQGQRAKSALASDENDPLVLNILGETPPTEEEGVISSPVDCVICGKKFVGPEYLVRHQRRKHRSEEQTKQKKKKPARRSSSSSESDASASDESQRKRKKRTPKTLPFPVEVTQALQERNDLAKQLVELQAQLQLERERRAQESKQAEQQQAQLATQVTGYMSKLQDMLVAIEQKQEQSKHEVMRYTQETIEKLHTEQAKARPEPPKKSNAGQIEDDDESAMTKSAKKATKETSGDKLEQIMKAFLRAQAEKQHAIDTLEQENRKLWSKQQRLKRRQRHEEPTSTLMTMAALDAQRYGIDAGVLSDPMNKPPAEITKPPASLEDKPVQTDEDRAEPPKPKPILTSIEIQTDALPVPVIQAPQKEEKPRLESKPESKLQTPLPAQLPARQAKPAAKPVAEEIKPEIKPAEPEVVPIPEPKLPEPKQENKFQHAAKVIGKVARGFLIRRELSNPNNWLIVVSSESLQQALSPSELVHFTKRQDSGLRDVEVEVEAAMTANELRLAIADALGQEEADDVDDSFVVPFDYHRVLLHHKLTKEELKGDRRIHPMRDLIEIEIIPFFDAAEAHVAGVLEQHDYQSSQIQDIRCASMTLEETTETVSHNADSNLRGIIRFQAYVRRFLARRTVQMMQVDRIVEARLVKMRAASHDDNTSLVTALIERRMTRAASVLSVRMRRASQEEDEQAIFSQTQIIHSRLADVVQQKIGLDTRTKSAKWSKGQLSAEEYEKHVSTLQEQRTQLPPAVQDRIQVLLERVEDMARDEYDPEQAKQEEDQYHAANRIQRAVQVTIARNRLHRLLDKSPTREQSVESLSREERDSPAVSDQNELIDEDNEKRDVELDDEEMKGDMVVEEAEEDDEIKRLADAYELDGTIRLDSKTHEPANSEQPKEETKPSQAVRPAPTEEKPSARPSVEIAPRPGTPPPDRDDLVGRSPRPKTEDVNRVISPFSKTPLLSRRAAVTRRGSGYDNAR
ncbi:hypothetical protein Poli38472_008848 [Pythium oligandrum]|uniref:C2H2-type domain-containing protein n=1 Tax=Pythium oligandrum TaxID=41045 RepID=A0A8K1C4C1_PYTOL|nr:hypothetical protein Poli38472_008848 [Pythium oligandrum]|eukprot:TMW56200.1 hypothetical protein Poli38472_008848 [Pythium oligandrum]